jgi:hypothetical protein
LDAKWSAPALAALPTSPDKFACKEIPQQLATGSKGQCKIVRAPDALGRHRNCTRVCMHKPRVTTNCHEMFCGLRIKATLY